MGAIQEPSPAMGGWGVECRSESAYLSDDIPEGDGPGRFTVRPDGVALPIKHLHHLLACVDLAWDWWIRNGTGEIGDGWTTQVTRDGDTVVITGIRTAPSLAYAHEQGLTTVHMLEPTYAELPDLHRKLNDVIATGMDA
ncbi:hypothetical protein [Nocardiopsis sp. NPDC057823]|uniref:hypothetical protein n=1 Tax=Nocardiopsis sp. NPDC057823 TaxID=3346256 RepID=UPI00366D9C2B